MASVYNSIFGVKKALKDAASQGDPAPPKVVTPAGIDIAGAAAKMAADKKQLESMRKRRQLQEAAKKK